MRKLKLLSKLNDEISQVILCHHKYDTLLLSISLFILTNILLWGEHRENHLNDYLWLDNLILCVLFDSMIIQQIHWVQIKQVSIEHDLGVELLRGTASSLLGVVSAKDTVISLDFLWQVLDYEHSAFIVGQEPRLVNVYRLASLLQSGLGCSCFLSVPESLEPVVPSDVSLRGVLSVVLDSHCDLEVSRELIEEAKGVHWQNSVVAEVSALMLGYNELDLVFIFDIYLSLVILLEAEAQDII